MRACIHRGTKEIGGTCVEIESGGQRIVLDVGLPLDAADADTFPLHSIRGFAAPDPSLLGVVISHAHQDHYGLAHRLPPGTPLLLGEKAAAILEAAAVFTPLRLRLRNPTYLVDRRPLTLGPFTITPYLMDHSAFDAYAILVRADGKSIFYSGDLRAHGRKGKLFERLLRRPPADVDVLLMEGTTLGRAGTERGFPTERELERRFADAFKQAEGLVLVWCSGQNIDRLVTILRACIRTGRTLVLDMYTAHILRATGNAAILGACADHARVFLPLGQKRQIVRQRRYDVSNAYKPWRIYKKKLGQIAPRAVMLFRPTMTDEVEQLGLLPGSRLIYSMWSGYLKDGKCKPFLDRLRGYGVPLEECHTSGHASVADLKRLRNAFAAARVVPVHTEHPTKFQHLFRNAELWEDGKWVHV